MNIFKIYCMSGAVIQIEAEDFERDIQKQCIRFYYTDSSNILKVQKNVAIFETSNICGIEIIRALSSEVRATDS